MNADKNDQKKLIRTSYSKDISVDFDNKKYHCCWLDC